jgi:hypothetical protein
MKNFICGLIVGMALMAGSAMAFPGLSSIRVEHRVSMLARGQTLQAYLNAEEKNGWVLVNHDQMQVIMIRLR